MSSAEKWENGKFADDEYDCVQNRHAYEYHGVHFRFFPILPAKKIKLDLEARLHLSISRLSHKCCREADREVIAGTT
jgi:hypothetical protein